MRAYHKLTKTESNKRDIESLDFLFFFEQGEKTRAMMYCFLACLTIKRP